MGLGKYGLIMWPALALKPGLLTAQLMHLDPTTVCTLKMLECGVKHSVSHNNVSNNTIANKL